ncbi:hypothetical protein [Abyssisolibacter fermentans]|uniref:hypothetical protein n=1 Tax=Abyssisolibacter fermentans TaxID=1766203 RepID=UPI000834A8E9|nr:hypothetical protein [Abyssisolibacter fermentans]
MKLKPKYAEDIIVLVKYNNKYSWYITDKEVWFLDLRKLVLAYISKGYAVPNEEDFSDRFNIDIVNESNADEFLLKLDDNKITTELLRKQVENIGENELINYIPSLYIDFDMKLLLSYFPEPVSYENYIPDNWTGRYENFLNMIDEKYRFWVVDGVNIFNKV